MLSNHRLPSRKALYLCISRTGVYTFRWSIRNNDTHHQPTLSLKTRDYLTAVRLASDLANRLLQISSPTIDEVKSIYDDFRGEKRRKAYC